MIQLILGNKGKGKTKVLLDKVNTEIKTAHGSIVYLDKSAKHMYELNNKVRLIDISGFPLKSSDEFIGFIYGILSQDHDLEQMYLDSFLTVAQVEDAAAANTLLGTLYEIGERFDVTFVISISLQADDIEDKYKEHILAEL
ncbi:MAG: twitching motility protein PilT [Lachnospiraceae bacterium]|nr:twitching motility protein PilT [Lachnospiraceae bacterium]